METIDIIVPGLGESITEVQVGAWLRQAGEVVAADEALVEIESEKATVELPAPAAGVLREILRNTGEPARVGEVIGRLEPGAVATAPPVPDAALRAAVEVPVMPAARALADRMGLDVGGVRGSGPGGRVLKEDVMRAASTATAGVAPDPGGAERVVPMSPLRRTIARRLVAAKQAAALLTTFNEVDMLAVRELRDRVGQDFRERHGVKLGFLSFFVKAAVEALREFPELGARVDGESIIYSDRFDIGIAVGGGRGLVVPVIRGADRLSLTGIEGAIADFGERARQGTILPAELEGGVFTISNGGVYGSLLSTPIVNPPQSGVLGLHAIQDRPVARDGQVVIRPMMYVALTYDHRIVDGREAVTFLRGIKLRLEDPARLLLEL